MRMQRPTLYLLVALGLLFCLQLTACGSQGIPGSQEKDGKSQRAQMAGPFSASSQMVNDPKGEQLLPSNMSTCPQS